MRTLAVLFILGLIVGALLAWFIQAERLTALQAKFDRFVQIVKTEGEDAQKISEAKDAENKRIKEQSDHEYQTSLDKLRADNQRLRNSRSRQSILPPAPTNSKSTDLSCFDRNDLESALQRFDSGVTELVDEGDENTLSLNTAKEWAAQLKGDKK